MRINMLGDEHIDCANSYYNIGFVYKNLNNLEKAKNSFKLAYEVIYLIW